MKFNRFSHAKWNIRVDKKGLIQGIAVLFIGSVLPFIVNDRGLGIYRSLTEAADTHRFLQIIIAFFKLIFMNTVRTTPIYFGTFMICEAFHIQKGSHRFIYTKLLVLFLLIYASFDAIYLITGVQYSFGAAALLISLLLTVILELKWCQDNIFNKGIIISLLFLITQVLNTYAPLNRFSFGRGEITSDLRNMCELLGYREEFNLIALAFLLLLLAMFGVIIKLFCDEYNIKIAHMEKEEMQEQLLKNKMEMLEARTYSEIRNIVHDLKTPITTIVGLSSLTQVTTQDEEIANYQQRILKAADHMAEMVNEILYEEQMSPVRLSDLIRQISSFIAVNKEIADCVTYVIECGEIVVKVNRIRMVRAVINLVDNAFAACYGRDNSSIELRAETDKDNRGIITVIDNGKGLDNLQISRIWEPGVSLNNSSGLGLAFVKSVVEKHEGDITISSTPDIGTEVSIFLRGYKIGEV